MMGHKRRCRQSDRSEKLTERAVDNHTERNKARTTDTKGVIRRRNEGERQSGRGLWMTTTL